jgi:hypothetical protein
MAAHFFLSALFFRPHQFCLVARRPSSRLFVVSRRPARRPLSPSLVASLPLPIRLLANAPLWSAGEAAQPVAPLRPYPTTNVSGVLSTLSQYDLWLLCEKNGLKQSWPMFSGQNINIYAKALDTGGSYLMNVRGPSAPLCLEFGSDIQLLNEDYPGKQGTWNFQIQLMPSTALIML